MERRTFLKSAALAGGATLTGLGLSNLEAQDVKPSNAAKFKLKYAPGLTAFSDLVGSRDLIDNIKFISDQGFILSATVE